MYRYLVLTILAKLFLGQKINVLIFISALNRHIRWAIQSLRCVIH